MKHSIVTYIDWCHMCLYANHRYLTDWETKFVESLYERMEGSGQYPSDKQLEILERIYTEKVP